MQIVKLVRFNEIGPSMLSSLKQQALFCSEEKQFLLLEVDNTPFNLMELVWNKEMSVKDKLLILHKRLDAIKYFWKNDKPLKFDIYYPFATDLTKKVINQQIKQLNLAIDVVKINKRWDRKYTINLDKRVDGREFVDFFKFGLTDHRLGSLGINYRREVSYKTLIVWADKLALDQMISHEKYNNFMEYLEKNSI